MPNNPSSPTQMTNESRGTRMENIRRARMDGSPMLLQGGFRPFFLGAAVWASIALVLWLSALNGHAVLSSTFDPLLWHRHEMMFGCIGVAVVGFLLTAIPNWTGRLPIAGASLALFFGLWLAARLAMLYSASRGPWIASTVDVGFFWL